MADPMISINIAVTAAGAQPTAPETILANLITLVAAKNPGYTVLPAGLTEDMASTATYAIALQDSAAVETINSVTPFAANPYLLVELGNIYGVPQGLTTNTSVYVVFTSNTPGVQIPVGYLVGDGTYQYQVQDGGVIGGGGTSVPLYCVATQSGSWPVAANSVTAIVSSIPNSATVTLSCTNPLPGTPSAGEQTNAQYAAAVLQAGLVSGEGNQSTLKTLLGNVPGVQPRLISARQNSGSWEIICGGGDPYEIANAIYSSGVDISTLVGSSTTIRNISVNLYDDPDTYTVIFVNPPAQTVEIQLAWNSISPNFVSDSAVSQLGNVALVNYVNSIAVGTPINLYALETVFVNAVLTLFNNNPALVSTMNWTISINGSVVDPTTGTFLVEGDPESYFTCVSPDVTITQV